MFKLLEKKWRNMIINELQDHIGKLDTNANKEITPKNLIEDAEISFRYIDEYTNDERIITGVIVEANHEYDEYTINSYENMYIVGINEIVEILNNTKFKYNLNKLNNIDFL